MKSHRPPSFRALGACLRPHVRSGVWPAGLLAGWLWVAPMAEAARMVSEQNKPAPSSSLSKTEAMNLGAQWKRTNPALRSYCEVEPTSSMVPILDSRCVLLLEKVKATELRKNDISIYMRDGNVTICHRVIEVRDSGVLFEGDNAPRSDGWVSPEKILWRVTAIIFTQRDAPASNTMGRGAR